MRSVMSQCTNDELRSLPESVIECVKLTTFLANNLKISGTIPSELDAQRRLTSDSAMVALSLARGYLHGSMDNLDSGAMPNLTSRCWSKPQFDLFWCSTYFERELLHLLRPRS